MRGRKRSATRVALAVLVAAPVAAALYGELPAQEPPTTPPQPLTAADWPLAPAEARGRIVYERNCIGCHGVDGRGDGPAAAFLDPLPRNFQAAKFKFRTTASGELPLPSDVMRTVTCGLPGSSMPGFPLVPEPQRKDVVQYVLHLAKLGLAQNDAAALMAEEGLTAQQVRAEHLPRIREEIERRYAELRRISVPPEPEGDAESVGRGRALFLGQCAACHGERGVGDGPSAYTLRDWQNAPIRPRDFTSGVFRAGSAPDDVFVRIRTGLNGTPMPGYGNLTDQQVWDLVHYILSMRDPGAPRPRMAPGCGPEEYGR